MVAVFLERAGRVQQEFAIAAMREEAAVAADEVDAETLRSQVEELRRELADKEALLAKHRQNVQRWQQECLAVQQSSEALLEPGGATGRMSNRGATST